MITLSMARAQRPAPARPDTKASGARPDSPMRHPRLEDSIHWFGCGGYVAVAIAVAPGRGDGGHRCGAHRRDMQRRPILFNGEGHERRSIAPQSGNKTDHKSSVARDIRPPGFRPPIKSPRHGAY